MAQNDPFTLSLFGDNALGSSLGIGLGEFAGSAANDPGDDDPDPTIPPSAPALPTPTPARRTAALAAPRERGSNFHIEIGRGLAKGWKERARHNIEAIRLAGDLDEAERPATLEEQARLIRFIGFGASELANQVFRRPGEAGFREGWSDLGEQLEDAVSETDYATLMRCTQYAHFTPEFIVRAIWSALQRLGWRGGRILEPGIGTGLFLASMPAELRATSHVTGIELDPVTARIVRLLQPRAGIINADFARTELPAHFDLAIGNPPYVAAKFMLRKPVPGPLSGRMDALDAT